MLIDYVGLPGCGKTYQTNLAKDYCKSKSISFIDFSHGKNAPFLIKVILLTIEKGLLYTTRYKRNLLEIKKKCLYSDPRFLPFSLEYCVQRIMCAKALYNIYGRSKKVVFDDEGIFQWVVFLHLQYGVPLEYILNIFSFHECDMHTIYVDISVEQSMKNIKGRNRHVCEMDEMCDETLIVYLKEFKDACDRLDKRLNFNRNFDEII